jgi:hypothetical protein
MMVAYGIPEVLKGGWRRKLALYVVAPLLMIVLLCVTRNQVLRWQSSTALFEHTLRVTINNSVIHNNLGVVLLAKEKTTRREVISSKP